VGAVAMAASAAAGRHPLSARRCDSARRHQASRADRRLLGGISRSRGTCSGRWSAVESVSCEMPRRRGRGRAGRCPASRLPAPDFREAGLKMQPVLTRRSQCDLRLPRRRRQNGARWATCAASMPGMAARLRRPPTTSRSRDYNRSQAAIGCYHCHRIK
jgi:hypothetical protein